MNFGLLVAVAVFGVCWCQAPTATSVMSTTKKHGHHHGHHNHTTKEPAEKEQYLFQYSPATHHLYIRKGHACYICTLTAQEKIDVHSDGGINALEIKFMQMMPIASNTSSAALTSTELKLCGGHHSRKFFTIP